MSILFEDLLFSPIKESDFLTLKKIEQLINKKKCFILGDELIEDIRNNNGFEFSLKISGKRFDKKKTEMIGYLVITEENTDENDFCFYVESISLLPEAQNQGIGWKAFQKFINNLKEKNQNKPILLGMHLRETSQKFFAKYKLELEKMGLKLVKEKLILDYYDHGEDALYRLYEVN